MGLADRVLLVLGVDDEQRVGQIMHVADAAQCHLELVELLVHDGLLLLGVLLEGAVCLHGLDLFHALNAGADRGEVGEHAAHPTVVDVGHASALGICLDGLLGLLLGADEQDLLARGAQDAQERVRIVECVHGLFEIENVDAVALAEDIRFHLRVPATGLVSEVDTGFQQGLDRHSRSHSFAKPPVFVNPLPLVFAVLPATSYPTGPLAGRLARACVSVCCAKSHSL